MVENEELLIEYIVTKGIPANPLIKGINPLFI